MSQILREKNLLVTFGDTDPQGILYFARIFELGHQALEEFIAKTSFGWSYWFQNPNFIVPIRHADSEYFAPVRAGKIYITRLSVERWGNTSMTISFAIFEAGTGKLCAKSQTTHVFVANHTFESIQIPDQIASLREGFDHEEIPD
jgi:YbgC/YbaW family acyl-CoA thioester hydrolase